MALFLRLTLFFAYLLVGCHLQYRKPQAFLLLSYIAILGYRKELRNDSTFTAFVSDDNFTNSVNFVTGNSPLATIYWQAGSNESDLIRFEVHAKTKGWIGIGFSPNGAMQGSDIVMMWIDANGKAQISVSSFFPSAIYGKSH
jgi:hypothetical protein